MNKQDIEELRTEIEVQRQIYSDNDVILLTIDAMEEVIDRKENEILGKNK